MNLSAPAPRRHLHSRTITCEGFLREDGLWDIEAQLLDTKSYAYTEPERGPREAGSPVHNMVVRLTLDDAMTVRDVEVGMGAHPYATCRSAMPAFSKLIGARVGSGWRKAVNEAVGAEKGCTHVRELLFPMATVAFQTIGAWREDGPRTTQPQEVPLDSKGRPYFLGGCKAWAFDSPVVEREFPQYYLKPE